MKFNKTILISVLLTWMHFSMSALPVTISGVAASFAEKEILAITYLDQFSKKLKIESTSHVDSLGYFSLSFDTDVIKQIILRCDYINAHMYVEPGKSYNVNFPILDDSRLKVTNNTTFVDLRFVDLDPNDINSKITDLNIKYSEFFNNNIDLIKGLIHPNSRIEVNGGRTISVRKAYMEKLQSLAARLDSIYIENNHEDFFFIYRKMVEADMVLNISSKPKEIFDIYISPYKVNIHNPEQVAFLKLFYEDYFEQFNSKHGIEALQKSINSDNAFTDCMNTLSQDDFLQDSELREFVLAYSILSDWNNHSLDKKQLNKILKAMSEHGSTKNTKLVAKNILNSKLRDQKGQLAFNFNLLDKYNERKQLSDYSGKYVVLEFWAPWCKSCLKEMSMTSRLQEKYKKDISFLSINIEPNTISTPSLVTQNKLKQTFLHTVKNDLLLEKYNIHSLPAYIIIDRDSKILVPDAPSPSNVLEEHLHKMTNKNKEKDFIDFNNTSPGK